MATSTIVTFKKATTKLLVHLAEQSHQSVESLVRELILEALDSREDFYLSKLADKIDCEAAKTYNHDEAWQ